MPAFIKLKRFAYVVSLTNYFPMAADGRATLKITAITEYFESDARKGNADIISLLDYVKNQAIEVDKEGVPHLIKEYEQSPVDTTPPAVTIKKSAIKGLLFAQGIAGAGQWDGTINVTEDFRAVSIDSTTPLGALAIATFKERLSTKASKVKQTKLQETFSAVHSGGIYGVTEFTEGTDFYQEEVPHGDGIDLFNPISLDGRFVLQFMKSSVSTDTEEGGK